MISELDKIMNSAQPDPEDVRRMASRYPYFTAPMVRLLQSGQPADPDLLRHLGSRVALTLQSRADRLEVLGSDSEQFDDFYPSEPEPERPDTATAIDTFISRFGPADPRDLDVMTRHIFGPQPIAPQTQPEQPPQAASTPEPAPEASAEQEQPEEPTPDTADNSSPKLMQSLAMVMVRQHNYSKALEIINQLSLKYPEKRFIFADQIRFLRKLIENDNQVNSK